jgi:hypothetical protein
MADREGNQVGQALAIAEREIRNTIQAGELDHNEVTASWIDSWAADIAADPERQAELIAV